ncbi:MAG: acyl-CoA reductase-like NAD-dependent aldehyde dehydrogenase [Pseudohongiellaceae bacterium]|jgi:acyl-CoA reductase-like NAD-dependent aldehyde dehydrogenase
MVPSATSVGVHEVTSAFDGKVVGKVPLTDKAGAEQALCNASNAFAERSNWLPAEQRVAILEKTAKLMGDNLEELVQLALLEGGKPYSDTKVEVLRAIDGVKSCVECIRTDHGEEIPMRINPGSANRLAMTSREPIGPVMAVSAFNHPLNLIVHQVAPAVASGCPVIVKPASDTALSCFRFVELLREAGLPDVFCQAIAVTDNTIGEFLVTDPRIAFFSFIGSAKVGWMLKSKLAPGTRCALEHGGVAPAIVAEDADLETALPLLVKGAFYHAGQVCVSVQRVYVHESIIGDVADRMTKLVSKLKVGDPADPETEVGPLIRHRETERVEEWVDDAVTGGAKVLCGAKKISDAFYEPTVLLNPPESAQISKTEVFGPVVCLYSYANIEEAIERANGLSVAFQASVMTTSLDTAMFAYKNLAASAVLVNDHTAFRVDWMPFAGLKQSGYGVGGIPYTFREMQVEKLLVIKSASL